MIKLNVNVADRARSGENEVQVWPFPFPSLPYEVDRIGDSLRTTVLWRVPTYSTPCNDFTGTVPNFDGLSRENYEVFRDAELSRIPNPVPILSCFECNVYKVYIRYQYLYRIRCCQMRSYKLQIHQIHFWPEADPLGEHITLPQTP